MPDGWGERGLTNRSRPVPDDLAAALQRVELFGRAPAVHYYPVVTSTNDVALRLAAEGAPEATMVVADEQSAGRGRGGHTWFSPPGAGIYVSLVLRPAARGEARDWPRWLTLAAGAAVAEGILSATSLPVRIKWPNDLVVVSGTRLRGARKLAGILTEAQTAGDRVEAVVVGCGINVGLSVYPADISARTTSIEAELGRAIDRALVLAATVEAIGRWVERLRAAGGAAVIARWSELAVGASGARVEWRERGVARTGITAGLDSDGALRVLSDGATWRIHAGEVTWL